MSEAITQRNVEEFLFGEADLLDDWRLDEWVKLFARECRYLVPSTDVPADAAPEQTLFYVADDRHRLEQRVIRLMKKTAHAEYPRSRTLHMISNVRIRGQDDGETLATCNFATYRTNRSVTDTYIGQHRYRLTLEEGAIRIREKRSVLALDGLRPHGRISMIVKRTSYPKIAAARERPNGNCNRVGARALVARHRSAGGVADPLRPCGQLSADRPLPDDRQHLHPHLGARAGRGGAVPDQRLRPDVR